MSGPSTALNSPLQRSLRPPLEERAHIGNLLLAFMGEGFATGADRLTSNNYANVGRDRFITGCNF